MVEMKELILKKSWGYSLTKRQTSDFQRPMNCIEGCDFPARHYSVAVLERTYILPTSLGVKPSTSSHAEAAVERRCDSAWDWANVHDLFLSLTQIQMDESSEEPLWFRNRRTRVANCGTGLSRRYPVFSWVVRSSLSLFFWLMKVRETVQSEKISSSSWCMIDESFLENLT